MKLSVKGLAATAAILWAGGILLVGILNLIWSGYGVAFLDMAHSLYPGYAATGGFGGVVVGTLYGALDGAICGALFAWVYNRLTAGAERKGAGAGAAA